MIPDIHARVIAIIGGLDHEEFLAGFDLDPENPTALRIDGISTSFPDDELDEYEGCALMGGLFSVLWARWRSKRLQPHIGGNSGSIWISVFDLNQKTDGSGHFPVYRAERPCDLDCVILAMELELGLVEGG